MEGEAQERAGPARGDASVPLPRPYRPRPSAHVLCAAALKWSQQKPTPESGEPAPTDESLLLYEGYQPAESRLSHVELPGETADP
jgi:hypothetical protein